MVLLAGSETDHCGIVLRLTLSNMLKWVREIHRNNLVIGKIN